MVLSPPEGIPHPPPPGYRALTSAPHKDSELFNQQRPCEFSFRRCIPILGCGPRNSLAELARILDELVSTSHACFGVEIAKVSAQRLLSDEQALRDLLIAEFLSKQGQDFALPATRLFVLPTLPTTIRDNEMIGRMMGLRR
jgi:hypothetical protein